MLAISLISSLLALAVPSCSCLPYSSLVVLLGPREPAGPAPPPFEQEWTEDQSGGNPTWS
ncbi:hypothetical protein DSO57_1031392 [Entomophthora muscae]|uniref:Uncharacterized protein n=1 Tax=Entomophthora muscae TaxID=34485 RepID=A0ACC2U9P1_9FUNG|nr:hypothetical protein DSO57_1031392 [Entomophthora muscae]